VVEDDDAIQALLHDLLREAGYTTSGCRAAQDAQYLIATDVRLVPATVALPIIVCLADAFFLNAKREELHALGCVTVAKPFDIEQLLQAVATALDAQRCDRAVNARARR
jgi:DNA-binding response OmpR family regulator